MRSGLLQSVRARATSERIAGALVCAVALASIASAACTPSDFAPPSLVARPRIVGMVTRIEGDLTRAAPVALDHVDLEPIVAVPEGQENTLSTVWFACLAAPSRSGVPSCGSTPLGVAVLGTSGLGTSGVVAPIALDIPPLPGSPFGAPSLLLTIASCDGGAIPALDLGMMGSASAPLPTCAGGDPDAHAEITLFTMPLATDLANANRHPSISDEAFTIRIGDAPDAPWDAPGEPLPTGGCASLPAAAALPHVSVSAALTPVVTLTWSSRGDDRETYAVVVDGTLETTTRREALQLSHFSTTGTFERQYSAVESAADDESMLDVEWTPPAVADIVDGGQVVRLWWVVRDLRGGMDVALRTLCIVAER